MGGENLLGVPTLLSGIVGKGQRMRGQAPRVGKVSWRFRIGPKPFLQTCSKPASHLQALERVRRPELRAPQLGESP